VSVSFSCCAVPAYAMANLMSSQYPNAAVLSLGARRGVRGAILFTAFTILSHFCTLAVMLVLSNVLGPERYGAVTFGLTMQSYFFLLGGLGIKQIIIYRGTQYPKNLDRLFTAHLTVTGLASGCVGAAAILGAYFEPISSEERVLLCFLAVGNVIACLNIQPLFDAHHHQAKSAAVALVVEAIGLLFIVAARSAEWLGVETAGAFLAGKWVVNATIHHLVYHYKVRRLRLEFVRADVRALVRSGWPLFLAALVAGIPFNIGVIFLRFFQGEADVALLGLGQQAAAAYILAATIGIRIVQPYVYGPRGLEMAFAYKLAFSYGVFLVIVLVGMGSAAVVIVGWLLDSAYRSALGPMLVLLGGAFVYGIGGLTSVYLIRFGQERIVLRANACAAIFYLAAGCFVIPSWSCAGAAFLTVVSAAIASGLLIAQLWICVRNGMTGTDRTYHSVISG